MISLRLYASFALVGVLLLWAGLAMAQDYKLGVGDVIKVTVYQQPELTTTGRINAAGMITMPLLGPLKLAGLDLSQAEARVMRALKDGGLVVNPQVVIGVEEVNSQQVAVLGMVNNPGKYPLADRTSLVDVLASAGGIAKEAGERAVVIRQQGGSKKVIDVDLGAVLLGANDGNIELVAGDTVSVPRMDVFYIYGEVNRPGSYRLERGMTVVQALAVGGGLTSKASQRGISVKRRKADGAINEVSVDLDSNLLPNDVIFIKQSLF